MSEHIVIVDHLNDWKEGYPAVNLVLAKDYLSHKQYLKKRHYKVINMCRSFSYLSTGYYCSLLAEARSHNVIPSVRTITDLGSKAIYSLNVDTVDSLLQRRVTSLAADDDVYFLYVFFGQCQEKSLQDISRTLYDQFRSPLLRVEIRNKGKWFIKSIKSVHLNALKTEQQDFFAFTFGQYLSKRWSSPKKVQTARYDLAILHNPEELMSPSNKKALDKFIRIGKSCDINVELVTKKDYSKIGEYDALFIRETTEIEHYTYKFARKAESEGIPVMDSGDSILRCTNKVYLSELLASHKVSTPRTYILQKGVPHDVSMNHLPLVLKIPDGSFSRGVFKASTIEEFNSICARLFKDSDLILAQEFLYTEFDWRIGVLNKKAIYACQYFMSKKHWQIVNHKKSGKVDEGKARTFHVEDVPVEVIDVALKAANLIGDGLYGVDLKQTEKGVFVIEVNDNPNLDAGVEDVVLGDRLYEIILLDFVRRIEQKGKSK